MKKIGIMTHQPRPRRSWLQHIRYAQAAGFQQVIFYTPQQVQLHTHRVKGFMRKNKKWITASTLLPFINHDIGYYTGAAISQKVRRIKRLKQIIFTGYGLGDKWKIHQLLMQCPAAEAVLISTQPLHSLAKAIAFITEHLLVILKPVNGSQGRDIYRIGLSDAGFIVETPRGNTLSLQVEQLEHFLQRKINKEGWVLQKYIDINGLSYVPSDIRVLVQKNGKGQWQLSGKAIRQGKGHGLICNIQKGGRIFEALPYLSTRFTDEIANRLIKEMEQLSLELAHQLESYSGKRYVELGFDFAVDQESRLWMMEINIKPGKKIMRQLHGPAGQFRSGTAPYRYARYLSRNILP